MDLGSDAGSSRSSSESNSSKVTPCSDCKSSPSPSSLDLAALDDDSEEEEEDDDEEDEAAYLPPRCPGPADALPAAPALRRSPQRSAAPRPRSHHRPPPPKQQQRRNGGGAPGPGGRRARRGGGTAQPPREPQPPAMDWAALERHLAGLQCREKERGQRANPASVSGERGGGEGAQLRGASLGLCVGSGVMPGGLPAG